MQLTAVLVVRALEHLGFVEQRIKGATGQGPGVTFRGYRC